MNAFKAFSLGLVHIQTVQEHSTMGVITSNVTLFVELNCFKSLSIKTYATIMQINFPKEKTHSESIDDAGTRRISLAILARAGCWDE
jgi:hypothetical protein